MYIFFFIGKNSNVFLKMCSEIFVKLNLVFYYIIFSIGVVIFFRYNEKEF